MDKLDDEFPMPPAAQAAARSGRRFTARFAEPDRVDLALLHPLIVEDGENGGAAERLDRLTIRRLTSGEMISLVEGPEAPANDAELIRLVVAAMAGLSREVLDALSPDDAGRVAAAALPFMPAGLIAALERQMAGEAGMAEAA